MTEVESGSASDTGGGENDNAAGLLAGNKSRNQGE